MKIRDKVDQVVESGVKPIEILYDNVRFFDVTSSIKRSFLQINSLDLGTLTYRQYRFVARRCKQGEALVRRHVHGILRELSGAERPLPITIPAYARTLLSGRLAEILFEGFSLFPKADPEFVCIEISADILYENVELARERIEEIQNLDVKIAIGEVGDEFCPVFRLPSLPFHYAFLDEYAVEHLADDNAAQSVGALVEYLHTLGVRVIAPALEGEAQIERARILGCDGYTAAREEVPQDEG